MDNLRQKLQTALVDLDNQIAFERKTADGRIDALRGRKAALKNIEKYLTDDVEQAVADLQKMGMLRAL